MAFRPNWYEQDDARRGVNPMASWSGLRWVMTVTIAAWVVQWALPPLAEWGALRAWWLVPAADPLVFNPYFPVQLFSYALLHDGLLHIGLNLLYLWFFAPALEDELGCRGFLRLYVVGAVVGGLAQWGWWLAEGSPGKVVGASGAVYAVMVMHAVRWPHRVILLFPIPLPVPLWLIVVMRVVGDLSSFASGTSGRTAVLAHLGGAAVGLLAARGLPALSQWKRRRTREKAMAEFKEETTDRREMDRILAKIQASGLASLDAGERSFLERRSRELRGRGP